MKYYFVADTKGKRHIIAAKTEESAKKIAEKSNLKVSYIYELTEKTFEEEGFLMTGK